MGRNGGLSLFMWCASGLLKWSVSSSYLLLKKDVISLEVEIHSCHNARHGSGPTFGLDSHQKARVVWGIEVSPGIGGRGGGRTLQNHKGGGRVR